MYGEFRTGDNKPSEELREIAHISALREIASTLRRLELLIESIVKRYDYPILQTNKE